MRGGATARGRPFPTACRHAARRARRATRPADGIEHVSSSLDRVPRYPPDSACSLDPPANAQRPCLHDTEIPTRGSSRHGIDVCIGGPTPAKRISIDTDTDDTHGIPVHGRDGRVDIDEIQPAHSFQLPQIRTSPISPPSTLR
jgi:hypothetical protein